MPAPPPKANNAPRYTNNPGRKQQPTRAKLNHLTRNEVNEDSNVVTGMLRVCSHDKVVLFDSGAIHSFISSKFICTHGIESAL